MFSLPILAALLVALLVFAVFVPGKKKPTGVPSTPAYAPWPTSGPAIDSRTLRQRQIEEDAAVLSAEFAAHEDARYRAEVRDRAARAFAPPAPPAAIAGPSSAAPVARSTAPAAATA
jgi:hypothetical protein